MNPLTNVKNITKLNETELATGSIHKKSWHDIYKDSAWIFIGGLEYGLTEGDVLVVFSQYGEIENINLVRDKKTGKSKGYCFLCYSNQKSTILAVDNLNGIKLCKRTIRVDHVANYKPPKENERDDEITKILKSEGCAPQVAPKLVEKETSEVKNDGASEDKIKRKKIKKEKKEKKKKKKKHRSNSSDSSRDKYAATTSKIKQEKHDPGYDKYDNSSRAVYDAGKKHHEKRKDYSNGECSYSNKHDRSQINKKDKIKIEPDSYKDIFTNENTDNSNHCRKKRKRTKSSSSSSDEDDNDLTSNNRVKYRFNNDRDESKRRLEHKRKSREVIESNSSSTDDADASSIQSSSDDEKLEDRYSRKDKYKTHHENRSNQDNSRDRSYHRFEDSYPSNRNKHSDKADKHDQDKSRNNYDEKDKDSSHYKNSHGDRNDSYYKDSHHHKRKSYKQ